MLSEIKGSVGTSADQARKGSQLTFEELESRVLLSVVPLTLDITRFETLPDNFPDDVAPAQFFAEITIAQGSNKVSHTTFQHFSDSGDFVLKDTPEQPNWSLKAPWVDTNGGPVSITLHVIDHDSPDPDDEMDTNPLPGKRGEITVFVDPRTFIVTREDGTPFPQSDGDPNNDSTNLIGRDPNFGFFSFGSGDPDIGGVYFRIKLGDPVGDADKDGLFDSWELFGIRGDTKDGQVDLHLDPDLRLPGANPDHKDLYVEVDAMQGPGAPPAVASEAQAIAMVVNAFAAVPNDVLKNADGSGGNPDGQPGITLHAALDETGIPWAAWTSAEGWAEFDAIKRDINPSLPGHDGSVADPAIAGGFGTADEQRRDPNRTTILAAKKLAYRYAIFADQFGATSASGNSEIGGNDFMVTFGAWPIPAGTLNQQASTFMHELGHTLGLTHDGNQTGGDDLNFKPNYHSVMNYTWTTPILEQSRDIATTQSLTAAGNLTLLGAFGVGFGAPVQVAITSGGNDSGLTFSLSGQDTAGNPISETMSGANSGVAISTLSYRWVTRISVNGPTAGAVIAGSATQQQIAFNNSWKLDFSRRLFNDLIEGGGPGVGLDEARGIGGDGGTVQIGPVRVPTVPPPAGVDPGTPAPARFVNESGPVDFDGDGTTNGFPTRDINFLSDTNDVGEPPAGITLADATPNQTLKAAKDWDRLAYSFRDSADFKDGVHTNDVENELTLEAFLVFSDQAAPLSALTVGNPQYPVGAIQPFVTTATSLSLSATDNSSGVYSVSYRYFLEGSTAPDFTRVTGASAQFSLTGADGTYRIETFATDNAGNAEPVHVQLIKLDNTAPVITIAQPAATEYAHSAILTLNYTVSDGTGSGVKSFTPTLDGATTLAGHGLQSGQAITLLTELALGTHTFTIAASDNLQNSSNATVTFEIIVTPESIKEDVNFFLNAGNIKNNGLANSLLAKLNAAADAIGRGQRTTAINIYEAFVNELEAQSDKGVDATAARIMMDDAGYLIAHIDRFLPVTV